MLYAFAKAHDLGLFSAGWTIAAAAGIKIFSLKPVPKGLRRHAELGRQFLDAPTGSHKIDQLAAKLRRVCPRVLFGSHWWTFLPQGESIHRTGPASDAGELWRSDNFRSKWTRLLKQAGIKHYSYYTCRHTMACATLRDGMPIQAVSKRLGHAKIATTLQHYIHALPNEADQGSFFFARRLASYLSPPKFATVHETGNGEEKVAV